MKFTTRAEPIAKNCQIPEIDLRVWNAFPIIPDFV